MPKIGFLPSSSRIVSLGVVERLGVAGTVGEEHAVGLAGPGPRRPWPCRAGSSRGSPCSNRCRAMFHFMPKSRATTCGSVPPACAASAAGRRQLRPSGLSGSFQSIGLVGNHLADQVAADQARGWPWPWPPRLASSRSTVDSTPFIAPRVRSRRTSARVSIPSMPTTPWRAGSRPGRRRRGSCSTRRLQFADDEPGQVRLAALDVLGVDAVVADLRVGHRDDLAAVARIGQDLLVAGHARVEADLAVDLAVGAEGCCRSKRFRLPGQVLRAVMCKSASGNSELKNPLYCGPIALTRLRVSEGSDRRGRDHSGSPK